MVLKFRRFLLTLTIALVAFFVALKSNGLYWPELLQPSQGYFGEGYYVEGPIDITLIMNLNPPSSNDSPTMELYQLNYQLADQVDADSICFDSVMIADSYVYPLEAIPELSRTENILEKLQPLCYDIGNIELGKSYHEIDLRKLSNETIPTKKFLSRPDSYWYPFDGYAFDFLLQVALHLENDGKSISKTILVPGTIVIYLANEANWDVNITSKRYQENSGEGNQLSLDYPYDYINVAVTRPIFLRIAYPLLKFLLFFLLLCLVP